MRLGLLIQMLEAAPDHNAVVSRGFRDPQSYRGFYDQLAFAPARDVTIGAMLADARWALGRVFTGYKGGDYRMDADTEVWLAPWGESSMDDEPIGVRELRLLIETARVPEAPIVEPCRASEGATGVDCAVTPAGHDLPHRGWYRHESDDTGEYSMYVEWPVPERPDFAEPRAVQSGGAS